MKVLLSVVFVFCAVNAMVAQSLNEFAFNGQDKPIEVMANQSQSNSVFQVQSFDYATRQRNTGRVITFVGIAELAAAGIIGISTLGQTTTTTCNPCTIPPSETSQDRIENVLFVFGAVTTTAGIIIWTKGSHKMKQSKLSFNWNGRGGVLRYKF